MICDDSIPLDIQTETKRNSFTLKNEQTNNRERQLKDKKKSETARLIVE